MQNHLDLSDSVPKARLRLRRLNSGGDASKPATVILFTRTGVSGLSRSPVGVVSTFFTTSAPLVILPNTGWRELPGVNQSR